jgi:hypothetical protein
MNNKPEYIEFVNTLYNKELLKELMNPVIGNHSGYPAIIYNESWFYKYSNHPYYVQLIRKLLRISYERWLTLPEKTIESFIDSVIFIFENNGVKNIGK